MNTSVTSYTIIKTDVSRLPENVGLALTLLSLYVSIVIYQFQILQETFCVHSDLSHACLLPRSSHFPFLIHPKPVIYKNYCVLRYETAL
jgi:hypothetical protein